jgi:hypothetical protein
VVDLEVVCSAAQGAPTAVSLPDGIAKGGLLGLMALGQNLGVLVVWFAGQKFLFLAAAALA